MNEDIETTQARRRLKRIGDVQAIFTLVIGAAAGLAVLSLVRLLSGGEDAFPSVIISLLVVIGVVGNALTRPRLADAVAGVELAARNVGRAEAGAAAD